MENLDKTSSLGEQLRLGMRQWTSGVGIAATEYEHTKAGLTVSSFTSISVDPPLVLISVNKSSYAHDLFLKSGQFGITLLAQDQQQLSDRFAGRLDRKKDRFDGVETFTLVTGSPLLAGGLAAFDCVISSTHDTGKTTVFFGKVVAAETLVQPGDGNPLLYYNQRYRSLNNKKAGD